MSDAGLVVRSREVLRRHARSFHFAGRFLPADRRDAAAVVYSFCRLVDDTADEAVDPGSARLGLEQIRAEVRLERDPRPVVAAVVEILREGGVGIGPALHLIEGVLGDLGEVRFEGDRELLRYCYRVAGTVGLMMCAVLGVRAARAQPFAIDLGVAMQLTNICRDVQEDAAMGRVYLPAQRLEALGVTQEQLLTGTADRKKVAVVVGDLLDLADRYYASADRGMHWIPGRSRLAIMVAARVYHAIGLRLRARNCDALSGRVWTGLHHKAWAAIRAGGAWIRWSRPQGAAHDGGLHTPLAGLPGAARR